VKTVPWYCRKCQTVNPDIKNDTCDECGEDFPDGWSDTKFKITKLLEEICLARKLIDTAIANYGENNLYTDYQKIRTFNKRLK